MTEEKKSLSFTEDQNWVKPHEDNWMEALSHLVGKDNVSAIEIGTWEGRSAHWFCSTILTGKNCYLFTVDRNHKRLETNYADLEAIHGDKLIAVEEDAGHFLSSLNPETDEFKFIYLDGSKDAGDVMLTSCLAWRLLKPGGILIWDDYRWPSPNEEASGQKPIWYGNPPRIAISAFLSAYCHEFQVIHHGWQIIIKKIR